MTTRLVLVRHGESILGRQRRYAGHRDTPLTRRGRRSVMRLRGRFARLEADRIISSDLGRCMETAALLAPGRPVTASRRLRELDFGAWEGLTAGQCRKLHPTRFSRWMRAPWSHSPPRGESLRRLRARVRDYAASLARRYPGETIALVTHAGPIRALASARAEDFWKGDVPPGAVIELEWRTKRRGQGKR